MSEKEPDHRRDRDSRSWTSLPSLSRGKNQHHRRRKFVFEPCPPSPVNNGSSSGSFAQALPLLFPRPLTLDKLSDTFHAYIHLRPEICVNALLGSFMTIDRRFRVDFETKVFFWHAGDRPVRVRFDAMDNLPRIWLFRQYDLIPTTKMQRLPHSLRGKEQNTYLRGNALCQTTLSDNRTLSPKVH